MSTNDQFQASIVAGIETPGSKEAYDIFKKLETVVASLEGQAKQSGQALVKAFKDGATPVRELEGLIRVLRKDLTFLSTGNKAVEIFKSDQVSKIREVDQAVTKAAAAFDILRRDQALARYELGLDSKTVREAANNMQILEKNLKAVDLALKNDNGNKGLLEKKKLLSDNKSLLEIVITDLKQQATQEKLNEDIAQRNFSAAKSRYAEVQRLSAQRMQNQGSAREQTRISNAQLDYSREGNVFAEMQARLKYAKISSAILPGKNDIALQRIQEQSSAEYLKQAYREANVSVPTISATLKDGPRVKALVSEIKDIEALIVAERVKGNVDLKTEAKLLEDIRTRMLKIENVRHDANLNDPEKRQARQDAQAKNMLSRASGEGGAALLAVQASLMANYSILTTTVGAMKAAITTSIDLEASFRNIQAVTATSSTEMGGLEERIKSVAAASKFSSLEVADAALILGQAGLSAKQVGEALQPVVMLASAAGTSIAQSVDLVTSVIGVFDKNTGDIADIANKITQAANSSKISVEKLALGFQYAGNAAAQVGISFEEVTAAMSAMSNAGIKNGSTMGTGLRQFLTETEKPSKEFLSTLQRLGLSLDDIDFKSHGLIGVIQRLREAGFVASDAIKSFDTRGAAAFNALIANPAELERQYRLLLDTKAGVEANLVQMDSLKSQSSRLTTSLGNLASAGFEPLSKILATTFSGFATVTQAISEHNIAVGIAGTAIAGLLASGAASFLASMAAGALRFATGAAEASVAVTALQNASKAGSLWTLVSAIAEGVKGLFAIAPMAEAAATATYTLTGAMTALRTAFMGLSIISGIGIAVAALTAAFYGYDYIANKSARTIDELKASTNTSKGAFEEKDAVVKSLTKRIEELTYKQNDLRGNEEALKTESLSLTSQFGEIGYQSDKNNISFETMIGKLRSLKDAMASLRKQNLELALIDNKKLLEAQVKDFQEKLKQTNGSTIGKVNSVAELAQLASDKNAKLTQQDREKLRSAASQLRAGNESDMSDVPGAALIAQRVSKELEASGGNRLEISALKLVADDLAKVTRGLSEIGTTKAEISRYDQTLSRDASYKKFNEAGTFGVDSNRKPLTFEEALPRSASLTALARSTMDEASKKDPLAIFNEVKKLQEDRAKVYEQLLKKISVAEELGLKNDKNGISKDVADTFKAMVNSRAEQDRREYLSQVQATETEATRKYESDKALLESRRKDPKFKRDKNYQASIEKQLADLETEFKTRGETDAGKAALVAERLKRVHDQNIQNIYNKPDTTGMRLNGGLEERSLRLQSESYDSEANKLKASTKTATSMDELDKILNQAIEAKIKAKNLAVEALLKKQANEVGRPGYDAKTGEMAHKLEMEALINKKNDEIETFGTSFIGLIDAAMTRLDKVTKSLNEQKRKITQDKMEGQDKVFEAQQQLREIDLAIATGKKTNTGINSLTSYTQGGKTKFGPKGTLVDMRGNGSAKTLAQMDAENVTSDSVTAGIRESLSQKRNRLVIEAGKIELEQNEKLLADYGDETSGLIGDATEAYKLAQEKVKELRAKLKTEIDPLKKAILTGELSNAEKNQTETFRDLRQAKGEKNQLRVDNFDIRKKIAENTAALPQEVSLDNILNKLDEVWNKYQDTVGKMDVIKTIGEGLAGVLGSTTGALGNVFASIASGTKSVKNAFKDMAISVIKSMIDILSQALAMQATKGVMGLFGTAIGLFGGGAGAAGAATMDAGISAVPMTMAASGGYIVPGGIQRFKGMAGGGSVTGGLRGRDSVPTMLMPGEFVVREQAVNAVGTDYLHALNSAANSVVSSSSPKMPQAKNSDSGTVNVWVVTPDQKPSGLGPRDVVAVVSDDINRGGTLKKLIKSVQMGQE